MNNSKVKNLKKYMLDRDLNLTLIAKKLGMSRAWISNVINGHFEARETRIKIAKILKVNYNEIWDDSRKAA